MQIKIMRYHLLLIKLVNISVYLVQKIHHILFSLSYMTGGRINWYVHFGNHLVSINDNGL